MPRDLYIHDQQSQPEKPSTPRARARFKPRAGRSRRQAKEKQRKTEKTEVERRAGMGIDGGEYSLSGKRGIGFGGDVCRAGFLCEAARGDFRFGDSIKNGARQGRAHLRAVARTRTPAQCPVCLAAYP